MTTLAETPKTTKAIKIEQEIQSLEHTGSTYSSTRGLSPREQLEMQADFHSSTQDES